MNILGRLFGVSRAAEECPPDAAALMPDRLARIRSKLDRLRRIDSRCQVFGAGTHRYRERPALKELGVENLERALGIALPGELRDFLKYVHGGGPGPGCRFDIDVTLADPELAARPFPYHNEAAAEFLVRKEAEPGAVLPLTPEADLDEEWPPRWGFVALTHLGCDIHAGIVVTGEQRGMIWSCADCGWIPKYSGRTQLGFLDWYEGWLDESLRSDGNGWPRASSR